jgi:hypothetical protein
MSYLDRINVCKAPDLSAYLPFVIDGHIVGYVKPALAAKLRDFQDTFTVTREALGLNHRLQGIEGRTNGVAQVMEALMQYGVVPGWRGEKYKVAATYSAPTVFEIERAAVPLFGTIGCGVHMNGVTWRSGELCMWVGKRSLSKPTGPGKLDQMVAGGQPTGISLKNNLIKECAEEANIPAKIAVLSKPVGAITYCMERLEGLRRDVLFIYDLVLPEDFEPENKDGEMEGFRLMTIDELCACVQGTCDFKFNCALVVIDFLIRHGYIDADHEDYLKLIDGLHGLDVLEP